MKKYLIAISVLIVLVVLIGAGTVMFSRYQETQRKAARQKKLQETGVAYQQRNIEAQEKLFPELENLLSDEQQGLKVRIRLTSIFNRFISGSQDAKKAAVDELKAMIRDASLAASNRAAALGQLGDFAILIPDETAKAIIFNDPPYDGYLREAKGDSTTAQRIIYEKTTELFPTALYHHLVAYWYAQQLMKNPALSAAVRSQYIETAKNHLLSGGALLNRDLKAEQANSQLLRPVRLMRPLFASAATMSVLGILRETEAERVEAGFNNVLDVGKKYVSDAATQDQIMLVRLWYADFLRQRFGESRREDIEALLKSLEVLTAADASKYSVTLNYFRKELAESIVRNPNRYRYVDYQDIQKLAAFDPQFKNTLRQLGWKF